MSVFRLPENKRWTRASVYLTALAVSTTGMIAARPTVARANTGAAVSVTLQAQANPISLGDQAAVTVTVAGLSGGTAPTGAVQISVDGAAASAPVTLNGGSSVWFDSALPAGAHSISAAYQGDSSFASGTSAPTTLVVLPDGTSSYVPLAPARILDTRPGAQQQGYTGTQPKAGATVPVSVTGVGGVPASGVSAVVLNVTATNSASNGYVTVWPSGVARPLASTLNLTGRGQTVPNLSTVPVGADGKVDMFTSGGTDLVADVQGYFKASDSSADGRLVSLTPARILDTRSGRQVGYSGGKPAAGATVPLQVTGAGGVPADGVSAVMLNVTATNTASNGVVTLWPAGSSRPLASNLNFSGPGQTVPNAVWVPVGANGVVDAYVTTGTDLVADVDGYFTDASARESSTGLFVPTAPTRLLDTRPNGPQNGYTGGRPGPGATVSVTIAGRGPIPAAGASAVVGNLTGTNAQSGGYVTMWPDGVARPLASNLNLAGPGATRAVLATSPLGINGALDLFTSGGTDLVFDVAGYFTADATPPPPVVQKISDQPAPGTSVLQPNQVSSITPGSAGTTVVLNQGVAAPAIGAGVVVAAGGAFADGATGDVAAVTANADGTTTLTLTPVPLDSLFDTLNIDYEGPAVLQPTVSSAQQPNAQRSATSSRATTPPDGGFDFASAFDCSASGTAVAAASLTFENTNVHFVKNISLGTTPYVSFYLTTEPVVRFSANVTGTVDCKLSSDFLKTHKLVWRFVAGGIPITVTLTPILEFTATATGGVSITEHFYRMIGFETNPDLSIHVFNAGSQHTDQRSVTGQLSASLTLGADTSVKVLDAAGIDVTIAPKLSATLTSSCLTLTAQVDGELDLKLNVWIKSWKFTVAKAELGPWTLYTNCPLTIATPGLPDANTAVPYSIRLNANGGTTPYKWSVDSGSLPDGLSLTDGGLLSGTPTTAGSSAFTVRVADSAGLSATADLTLNVDSTAPCVYDGTIGSCASTDPTITVDFINRNDTSACVFTTDIDWGDGQPIQVVTFPGGPTGPEFLADHTYTQLGSYMITITGSVVSGNCYVTNGSLEFTLQPAYTGHPLTSHTPLHKAHRNAPPTGVPQASGGVTS